MADITFDIVINALFWNNVNTVPDGLPSFLAGWYVLIFHQEATCPCTPVAPHYARASEGGEYLRWGTTPQWTYVDG